MGMLGEFEYDTVFNDVYNPMSMAWAIYVAYLVINCIILMNLLVSFLFLFLFCNVVLEPSILLMCQLDKTPTTPLPP